MSECPSQNAAVNFRDTGSVTIVAALRDAIRNRVNVTVDSGHGFETILTIFSLQELMYSQQFGLLDKIPVVRLCF